MEILSQNWERKYPSLLVSCTLKEPLESKNFLQNTIESVQLYLTPDVTSTAAQIRQCFEEALYSRDQSNREFSFTSSGSLLKPKIVNSEKKMVVVDNVGYHIIAYLQERRVI